MRNPFANDRVPVREKRDAFVWRRAFDRRGNDQANWCRRDRDDRRRHRRDGRRRNCGVLVFSTWPSPPRLDRRLDDLLAVADGRPVELDVGILQFDLTEHLGFERIAADADTARRAEHVQNLRTLTRPVAIQVHQIRGFVPALIANDPQERHNLLALESLGGCCRLA